MADKKPCPIPAVAALTGATIAAGTPGAHIADLKVDYTTGDLDAEAEVIAAVNATNAKVNTLISRLEAFGINADS